MGAIKLGLALTSREGLAAGVGKTVSTFTPLPRRKCTKTLETAQPVYRDELLTPLLPSQFLREKGIHTYAGVLGVNGGEKRVRRS